MRPVVPFLSESSAEEREAWQTALPAALDHFAEVVPFDTLSAAQRTEAKVAIVANPDPAKVAALPNLVWVQSLWAGVERLVAELPANGPKIVRMTDPQMADTMSEAVLAWTLYLHRDMPRYASQQRQKIWREHTLKTPDEQTVAVLGLGKLGLASARRLQANGFNVVGWSRSEKVLSDLPCFHGNDGLKHVLRQSDINVLLMPLTRETRGMIGATELGHCKPGAAIINFARGPILDTGALLAALQNGPLSHAVLDVFDEEPLPETSPLWDQENVTVLPHISAPTITSTACGIVAANIGAYFQSGEIPPTVDRDRGY